MYNEWPLIEVNALFEETKWSVLHKLSYVNGQNIVNAVVRPLAGSVLKASASRDSHSSINSQQLTVNDGLTPDPETVNYLRTDRDVQWVMEVICYGLSLPINTTEQHEALRDCVHIYCEWMYALAPQESTIHFIPSPILSDPNAYFRKIIQHLYNVFLPRTNSNQIHPPNAPSDLNSTDIISRQAMLCHRVLRRIASITQGEANLMDRETWDLLLLFLLAINNSLLAPPADKEDIGRTKLCERVVSVLFEIWMIACHKYFPNPSFWKTFHSLCCSWRHQPALIDQWSRVCLVFTQRLLQLTYNIGNTSSMSDNLSSLISPYCIQLVNKMSKEIISEAWYKFLNTIGNPVDLHSPSLISKTCKFHHYTSESVVDPRQHPCMNELPHIFHKAMKGLSMLVDTFLGLSFDFDIDTGDNESTKSVNSISSSVNSTTGRKTTIKGNVSAPKIGKKGAQLFGLSQAGKPVLSSSSSVSSSQPSANIHTPVLTTRSVRALAFSQSKPKVNSILNVLGNWLFNACMITSKSSSDVTGEDSVERSSSSTSMSSGLGDSRKGSVGGCSDRLSLEISASLMPENFEAGQAEAIGALSRLFSSKRTDEEISPVYLARFYLTLQSGLSIKENTRGQVLSSILMNGTKLFQINLNGINILIPDFLGAMEMIINENELEAKSNLGTMMVDLRRAVIKLLLSMISYPLHFDGLPIKDSLSDSSSFTFRSLRPRMINLMINTLKSEQDSLNVQMLLSAFLICVQESIFYEKEVQAKNSNLSENIHPDNRESSRPVEVFSNLNLNDHSSHPAPGRSPMLSNAFLGRGGIPDTARDIFSRTLNLVCQLLSNNWRNDTQVTLAALETLIGMARMKFHSTTEESIITLADESKLVTRWICDFISYQCSRPPPHHSKDMHSTIVAAYQCLNVWFHEHSYLLNDKDCINYLMDVIELGISGSKSRTGSTVILKAQKELKPASMRVREAAESLLSCLMNHFGNCPSPPCPPELVTGCSLLDEASILKVLGIDYEADHVESCSKLFKYFVVENSILLAFVDHPAAKRSVCIIRSPFGKYCWSMRFQVLPLSSPRVGIENVPRPVPQRGSSTKRTLIPRFFPESLEKIPLTKIDTVVPNLTSVIKSSGKLKTETEKMIKIVEKQALDEKELEKRCLPLILFSECRSPKPKDEMDCSRLILSHLGFLTLDSKPKTPETCSNPLIYLDSKNADLFTDTKALDMISTRTSDTAFIFYVRKGRVHPQEILNSVSSKHYVSSHFIDFLSSLGCSMKANMHCGWTGNVFTSWKLKSEDSSVIDQDPVEDHGGSAYDGQRMVLYWADVCHEIAFIVPSGRFPEEDAFSLESESKGRSKSSEGSEIQIDVRSVSSLSDDGNSNLSRNLSETESSRNSWRKKNKQLSFVGNIGCDTKILVIWLESLKDEPSIPITSLLLMTNTGVEANLCSKKNYVAILVHPYKNDLFAIRITSSLSKIPPGLPLVDGMVVGKRILGFVIRMTCLNLCKRRRLDAESFQPPHMKRRLKIQEIAKKFQTKSSDFYYSLFA